MKSKFQPLLAVLVVGTSPACEQRLPTSSQEPTSSPKVGPQIRARFTGLEADYSAGAIIQPSMIVSNDGDAPAFLDYAAAEVVKAERPDWKEIRDPETPTDPVEPAAPVEIEPGEEAVVNWPGFEVPPDAGPAKCAATGFAEILDGDGNLIDVVDVVSTPFTITPR